MTALGSRQVELDDGLVEVRLEERQQVAEEWEPGEGSGWLPVEVEGLPAPGEMVAGESDKESILIANVCGNLYGLGNVCTHQGAWLDMGTLWTREGEVECPLHGGRFNLATGRPTRRPCRVAVPVYEVRAAAGRAYVKLVPGESLEDRDEDMERSEES